MLSFLAKSPWAWISCVPQVFSFEILDHRSYDLLASWMQIRRSTNNELMAHKLHSQASSIALEQTRQRYLYLLSSTNLPSGWWTLTDRRPTNSLMKLLFPELKTHYRLMLDSKICSGWIRTSTYAINSRGEYPSRHRTSNQNKTRCSNSV